MRGQERRSRKSAYTPPLALTHAPELEPDSICCSVSYSGRIYTHSWGNSVHDRGPVSAERAAERKEDVRDGSGKTVTETVHAVIHLCQCMPTVQQEVPGSIIKLNRFKPQTCARPPRSQAQMVTSSLEELTHSGRSTNLPCTVRTTVKQPATSSLHQ